MSWIPCSERLPEDLTPVNITWTNHFPPDYYAHIKDVHFTYTGIFYKGKWYWWSAYAKDTLAEYGNDEVDEMADEIEVLAWQPLPEPWKGEADDPDGGYWISRCSECDIPNYKHTNYCPNCGARMEEVRKK